MLPVVIICVVALVAVLGVTALLSDRGGDGPVVNPQRTYKNEDYKVPTAPDSPPPFPQITYGDVEDVLLRNKLYDQELPVPVRCELTAAPAPGLAADPEALMQRLDATLDCLLRVWGPSIEAAGYTVVRPKLFIYDSPMQNGCGKTEMGNAQYCGATDDQNIYFATDLPTIFPEQVANGPWLFEAVMAHEFAHAVQGRSAILLARGAKMSQAETKTAQIFQVKRTEAQADCLSGAFFRSVEQSLNLGAEGKATVLNVFGNLGRSTPTPESTHPYQQNRRMWATRGWDSTPLSVCGTWAATDDEVI
ncbi:neutral zinc metallopeptidase [Propionibacteriaceae bacterium G1746]